MKLTQVSTNLHQLCRLGFFNCYLLREDDGFTLIDTTMRGACPDILAAARKLDAPIKRILLTHAHGDHIGSLDELTAELRGIEVAISKRDNRLLHKDLSLDYDEPQSPIRGSVPGAKTNANRFLADGDRYGSLRCLATPGHTPGHFSFFDERDSVLIAGDALCSVGTLRVVSDAPLYFPLPKWASWHAPTCVASAGRLLEFRPQTIVCGHGAPVKNATARLEDALQRVERK